MKANWILHNSHDLFFRTPFGAVPCGQKITLSLQLDAAAPVEQVVLRLWKNGREEEKLNMYLRGAFKGNSIYQIQIKAPQTPGPLWYYFIVQSEGKTYYYGNNRDNLGGTGEIYLHEPPSFQITVYRKDLSTPHWFKESVIYQIFVDRFFNGHEDGQLLTTKKKCYIYKHWEEVPYYRQDPETGKTVCFDFFGGNLLGVMKKLPYLKELGINVIYFNPIFEAPSSHKYDTADYKKIDSMYGDNDLFIELCQKAKEMGIYIILDGVFSHTGSDSIYFNKEGSYPGLGAYQSKDSPYYSWYTFYEYPDHYDCWWGIDTLPNVNELEPSYQNFIIYDEDSVIRRWMRMGAKGWRLDVADELPDEFIKAIRQVMKETDPESVLIGEVWEDASNKISYGKMREYLLGDELDSVMNYPFRNIVVDFFRGKCDAYQTHRRLMSLYENYPREHFYSTMNLVGTHDVSRILTVLGDAPPEDKIDKKQQACYKLPPDKRELAIKRLKLVALFQMTFPGVPSIYYGDEAGMEGYSDPLCRATYPWGKENKELLNWYKKVIQLRNSYDALRTGEWIPVYARGDVYGYMRRIDIGRDVFNQPKENATILVLFNRHVKTGVTVTLDISHWLKEGLFTDLLTEGEQLVLCDGVLNVSLPPLSAKLLIKQE